MRAFLKRHRMRIFAVAGVIELVSRFVDLGGLRIPARVVLAVGGFLLLRWLARRFFFSVSRRLGTAFVFVGLVPLMLFALLVMIVVAIGTLSMATHEAELALGQEIDRIRETARTASAFASASTRDASLPIDPEVRVDVRLSSAAGDEPVPEWALPSFAGLVSVRDSIRLLAVHTDGDVIAVAHRPVDETIAKRIAERTGFGIEAYEFYPRLREDGEWEVARHREGPDTGTSISAHVDSDDASSVIEHAVLRWPAGDTLRVAGSDFEDGRWPIFAVEFGITDFFRARAGAGVLGGIAGKLAKWTAIILAGMSVVAILIGVGLTSSVTRAVNSLHKGTRRVAEGDLDHRIQVRSKDQLGALAASFNEMSESVNRLLETKAEKDRLDHEMRIAAEVQQNMLPAEFPSIPGLEGAATSIMAKQVGGDLYDFVRIEPGRLAVVIGDVSGKGVSAALVMSNVISAIRSMLVGGGSTGPADLMIHLNDLLYRTTQPDAFVTLFYAEYDMKTGKMIFANAGHDWPMVVTRDGQEVNDLPAGGVMLGAFPDLSVKETELDLRPGDVIVAYSDGLIDTVDVEDRPFERERVQRIVCDRAASRPTEIVTALDTAVRDWQGETPEIDDVTIVVLKRVPLPGVDAPADGERREGASERA